MQDEAMGRDDATLTVAGAAQECGPVLHCSECVPVEMSCVDGAPRPGGLQQQAHSFHARLQQKVVIIQIEANSTSHPPQPLVIVRREHARAGADARFNERHWMRFDVFPCQLSIRSDERKHIVRLLPHLAQRVSDAEERLLGRRRCDQLLRLLQHACFLLVRVHDRCSFRPQHDCVLRSVQSHSRCVPQLLPSLCSLLFLHPKHARRIHHLKLLRLHSLLIKPPRLRHEPSDDC
mmetsp:Transcript_58821/g.120341  ORF Transcript_58821/g.120341 Transcript_58821/m.120341 type:complete len:234 (+) Transcript_58821:303-1004(+)